MSRKDVIVVASVSCIYGLGNPENFMRMGFELKVGDRVSRREILERLVSIQYERNEMELAPGRFRAKGETIDLVPGYFNNIIRVELFGDEVERISETDRQPGLVARYEVLFVYPPALTSSPRGAEGGDRVDPAGWRIGCGAWDAGAHRLETEDLYDIEMIA